MERGRFPLPFVNAEERGEGPSGKKTPVFLSVSQGCGHFLAGVGGKRCSVDPLSLPWLMWELLKAWTWCLRGSQGVGAGELESWGVGADDDLEGKLVPQEIWLRNSEVKWVSKPARLLSAAPLCARLLPLL